MKISQQGIDLIKRFEGCRLTAYKCPAGVWTIGYGHTKGVRSGDVLANTTEAEELLREDLIIYEQGVSSICHVELSQGQYDALVSFAYNLGVGALKGSTLLKRLNEGDKDAAAEEFMKWTKAGGKVLPGLVTRRKAEQRLFIQ